MEDAIQPLISRETGPLRGTVTPPGDKSISHRAIMLGGIAEGDTVVRGLLEGEDVLCTVSALLTVGAHIKKEGDAWYIKGRGLANLIEPCAVLDMGNSGTSTRLLIGLLAGRPFKSSFTGDASLRKRPMNRVINPLKQMGALFDSPDGRLPLSVTGPETLTPIAYCLPMASAQVKSAVLLAGLSAAGTTTVIESIPTRDHTERMLKHFGANLIIERMPDGTESISVTGPATLKGQNMTVPGDISSAAFLIVAALLRPASLLTLQNVGVNPRRDGLIRTLKEMGADITLSNEQDGYGEPTADITVQMSALKGVTVPAGRAPSMIDEYPILAMAAACAEGTTRMCGLGELRVKESDRLSLVAKGLKACGANVEVEDDDLLVHGKGRPPNGGTTIKTAMDHRIAMSFLVLGMATPEPIKIDDGRMIATSFPGFVDMMNGLGARIESLS